MSVIVGGLSIVFMMNAEAGTTTIQMPDYGAKALPCHSLAGYNANSLVIVIAAYLSSIAFDAVNKF